MIKFDLCIVGAGPRGMYALERLLKELEENKATELPKIVLFERDGALGCGNAWQLDQPDSNWTNISDRALQDLEGRRYCNVASVNIPSFPSYVKWLELTEGLTIDHSKDKFPKRSLLGAYLNSRFERMKKPLVDKGVLYIYNKEVLNITKLKKYYSIETDAETLNSSNVLITIGHQETASGKQITQWLDHSKKNDLTFIRDPYDGAVQSIDAQDKVGIRGMGLATIDVIRQLTTARGATFSAKKNSPFLKYQPSETAIKKIIPFSLNGTLPRPKPVGYVVDKYFTPITAIKNAFINACQSALHGERDTSQIHFITEIFSEAAVAIIRRMPPEKVSFDQNLDNLGTVIQDYLETKELDATFLPDGRLNEINTSKEYCLMALGTRPFTLDYSIGQIWRQLQPSIYLLFSHADLAPDVMDKLIEIDEWTKPFSYGPPVVSSLQLIALEASGALELSYANDPNIELEESGWTLGTAETVTVQTMINAVLPGPAIEKVTTPLVKNLLENNMLNMVISDLGIETNENGCVITQADEVLHSFCFLGRLCKGSVLGVDAILECFGPRVEAYARHYVERFVKTQ